MVATYKELQCHLGVIPKNRESSVAADGSLFLSREQPEDNCKNNAYNTCNAADIRKSHNASTSFGKNSPAGRYQNCPHLPRQGGRLDNRLR